MKRMFIAVMILFIPAIALAQESYWSLDVQTSVRNGRYDHFIGAFTGHQFKNTPYGVWGFAGVTPSWAEYLIGPSYNMKVGSIYASFGIGAGVEQSDFTPRFAMFIISESDDVSTLLFAEIGEATGFWYMAYFVYQVTPFLGVGMHAQQYVGLGPQIKLSKGPVYLWGGPMTGENEWGAVFGAGVSF